MEELKARPKTAVGRVTDGPLDTPASHIAGFDYAEMTQRNIGFVSEDEQQRLRQARVFVCGVGGMGGACLMSLIRAGIGRVILADLDEFELSNLNRQLFASLDTVGVDKIEATRQGILALNPEVEIETYGADWVDSLDEILGRTQIVVNGMDDIACGLLLYRRAQALGATVIDAYASPLPSVTVVRPADPRPEMRLGYATEGTAWNELSEDQLSACLLREIEFVMTHSSSRHHIDLAIAAQVVSGQRSRMSFAPMVITAGNLMCFETINLILQNHHGTDCKGYFFNPWTVRVERPRGGPWAAVKGLLVRRFLAQLIAESAA